MDTTRPAFRRLRRLAITLLVTLPVAGLTVWLFNLASAALAPYQTWFQVALALVLGLWFLSVACSFTRDWREPERRDRSLPSLPGLGRGESACSSFLTACSFC